MSPQKENLNPKSETLRVYSPYILGVYWIMEQMVETMGTIGII